MNCLILSAGRGVRMGTIGKVLPKPLWPIFEIEILFLQIMRARQIGCKKIFVNVFHLAEEIKNLVAKSFPEVEVIQESELLGVGGAIYNLKNQVNISGKLFIVNSDVFYFFSQDHLSHKLRGEALLFSLRVPSNSNYNRLLIKENRLEDILENRQDQDFLTYSGVGIVNLDKLESRVGYQAFFKSVADFRQKDIEVMEPQDCEYWDLGTKQLFYRNILRILELYKNKKNSKLLDFLIKENALDKDKINPFFDGYNCKKSGVINLSKESLKGDHLEPGLYYGEFFEEI